MFFSEAFINLIDTLEICFYVCGYTGNESLVMSSIDKGEL